MNQQIWFTSYAELVPAEVFLSTIGLDRSFLDVPHFEEPPTAFPTFFSTQRLSGLRPFNTIAQNCELHAVASGV